MQRSTTRQNANSNCEHHCRWMVYSNLPTQDSGNSDGCKDCQHGRRAVKLRAVRVHITRRVCTRCFVVKNRSSRGPGFDSQHPHSLSQCSVSEDPMPSSGLGGHCTGIHAGKIPIYAFEKKISRQDFGVTLQPVLALAIVNRAALELTEILLLLPPECWN